MIEITSCAVCDGPIRHVKRALVAPFLAKRIWNRKPFSLDLVRCQACGFMFYNPRLDNAELQRAYSGYRSNEYLKMRNKFEPWYTEKFNADLASDSHYESRRAKLAPIFKQNLDGRKIRRVLDYGGDHGDLMLGLFGDVLRQRAVLRCSHVGAERRHDRADGLRAQRNRWHCRRAHG